jgi:anti-sigma regulatory factor (Ser/Thr protein kinase)
MPNRTLDLVLVNQPAEISRLVDSLEAFGAEAGLTPDVAYRLTLSLDEVVANVIRHGFQDDAEHQIRVHVEVTADAVTAVVEDDGLEFDPRDAPLPNLEAPLDDRGIGGLGMHLVRASMDSIDYRREGGRNVFTMATSLTPRAES